MRLGPGVDKILDLHRLDLADESIGTAILMDTLEHVEYPHLAVKEVFRVLQPGGLIVMSSVMNFPIHDYPYDYWRFTPTAFQSLLKDFATSWVEIVGAESFPHTVVGIGLKGEFLLPSEFHAAAMKWKQTAGRSTFKQVLRQFIPPIVIHAYDRAVKKS
jgi:hypothetical protein